MPKQTKQFALLFSLVFPLLVNLSACVPVVVVAVGAAAGKTSVGDKSPELPEVAETPKPEPVKHFSEASDQKEISAKSASPNVPPLDQTIAPEQLPKQIVQEKPVELAKPHNVDVVAEVHHLVNRGWKVKLSEVEKNNMMDGILYFDTNNNYYGFDGCKNFKGKYLVDAPNQLMIKTLIVSSKGSNDCGNDIERNLFFVNSFKLHDTNLVLSNNEKSVITLTNIDNFNVKAFLMNAKIKYRSKKPSQPKH